jgi:hypothetical protein
MGLVARERAGGRVVAAFPEIANGWQLSPENMGMLADAFRQRLLAFAATGYSETYSAIAETKAEYYDRPLLALIQGTPEERCCWRQMQEDLEWMVADRYTFYDSAAFDEDENLPFYSLASWRAAAGLPSGGFRRGEAGTDYGLIQDRDPLRGWIVEDIISGLAALRCTATAANYSAYSAAKQRRETDGYFPWDDLDAAWQAVSWEDAANDGSVGIPRSNYCAEQYNYETEEMEYSLLALRAKLRFDFRINAPVAGTAFWIVRSNVPFTGYWDLEGHAKMRWYDLENNGFAASVSAAAMADWSMTAPTETPVADEIIEVGSITTGYIYALIQWDFSHV